MFFFKETNWKCTFLDPRNLLTLSTPRHELIKTKQQKKHSVEGNIFTYIFHINYPNVGKYTFFRHGSKSWKNSESLMENMLLASK